MKADPISDLRRERDYFMRETARAGTVCMTGIAEKGISLAGCIGPEDITNEPDKVAARGSCR